MVQGRPENSGWKGLGLGFWAVAKQKGFDSHPCSYVRPGGTWPDGPLKANPPPEVLLARHVSTVLRDYCAARGLNSHGLAAEAQITQRLSYSLLHGRSWPNLATLAKVERTLGVALWVGQHHAGRPPVLRLRPNQYLARNGTWPDGPLIRAAPPEARDAQHIAIAFRDICQATKGLTIADAAARAQIPEPVLQGLLDGDTWPDLVTVARLERALGVPLWASQHHAATPKPLLARPNCYVRGGTWPDGGLVGRPPPEVLIAQHISKAFRGAYDVRRFDLSDRDREDPAKKAAAAAKEMSVSTAVIEGLLNGNFWPDLATIARLERYFDIRIWPPLSIVSNA